MAASYILLSDLKAGRCTNTAEVRLLRFWEARNIKRGGELMSIDMLLIDENSTLVQGSIGAIRQLRFRQRLAEGSVYTLSGFDVVRSNPNYRLTDTAVSIRFNDGTAFEKLSMTSRTIPTEAFRFLPYTQIRQIASTGKQLPDVVGELSEIRSTITDRLPGAQRVMITLQIERDINVCVSMFDSLAVAFQSKFDSYGREPRIILVTSVNPKIVAGKIYLNGTSATHIYFDSETAAGKDQLDRLTAGGTDQSASSSKVVHSQKIEPMTISELNQFVITADPQVIEFLCTAKVTEIQLDEGWCYIGHAGCSKKVIREESSFTCVSCNQTNALAELRYRVIFSVVDSTGTAAFLGFDMEVAKLTHIPASQAARIVGIGMNAKVDTDLPQSLAAVVGNTYTFQLKLKEFNFTPNHQTFTISRMFHEQELAPMPTFVEGEQLSGATLPEVVEPGSAATVVTTTEVASQATTTDNSLHNVEGNAMKKPRVE